jgi:hypothetical protein
MNVLADVSSNNTLAKGNFELALRGLLGDGAPCRGRQSRVGNWNWKNGRNRTCRNSWWSTWGPMDRT